jgi:tetratricopeptide (TPR) repeat protein
MDPNFPMGYYWLGLTYGLKALYEEAIRALQAVPRSVGTTFTTLELARVYAASGRTEEARQLLADMQETFERDYAEPLGFATVYAALGEVDKAFKWLERASLDRSGFLAMWVNGDPRLDSLRSDPRMSDLLRRVGFDSPNR